MSKSSQGLPSQTKVSRPKNSAGGLPAVFSSAKHILNKAKGSPGQIKKSLARSSYMNQKDGFDCPGCAWPDPDDKRSRFEYCENGIKALAEESMPASLDAAFFAKYSVDALRSKGEYWLSQQGRLQQPMVWDRRKGRHFNPSSWEEAFSIISRSFKKLENPDKAVFYTSGRTSNEAAFLYQLLARKWGTNNLPDCSNLCHESSGVALKESIGIGKGTVTLDDFSRADLIIVIGQNPGSNHPRMLSALQKAVRGGTKIVSVNPMDEAGLKAFSHPQELKGMLGLPTKLQSMHFQVKINGDAAFFKLLQKALFELESRNTWEGTQYVDQKFIADKTEDFGAFYKHTMQWDDKELEELSGISKKQVYGLAELMGRCRKVICCWAMGVTQHKNAVATIQEIVNLQLMRGQLGKPGAGLCPVRGHSNVQGDRTMGITTTPSEDFVKKLEVEFGFKVPSSSGRHVLSSIEGMLAGDVDVFVSMGGNFISASPATEDVIAGFRKLQLNVQIATKLNFSHLYGGEQVVILPCLARSDKDIQASGPQFVTVENSMGVISKSQSPIDPPSKALRSEVAIVSYFAEAILNENWDKYREDYGAIRNHIEAVIPGFTNFDNYIKKNDFFYLPNPIRDDGTFPMPRGKAKFFCHDPRTPELQANQFLLMTIRSHDQYNTTIYGLNDRYRGIAGGRKVLFMNVEDMLANGLERQSIVSIHSDYNGVQRYVHGFQVVPYELPRRCLAAYFPETNPLVPREDWAEKSYTPISKSVVVRIEKNSS